MRKSRASFICGVGAERPNRGWVIRRSAALPGWTLAPCRRRLDRQAESGPELALGDDGEPVLERLELVAGLGRRVAVDEVREGERSDQDEARIIAVEAGCGQGRPVW